MFHHRNDVKIIRETSVYVLKNFTSFLWSIYQIKIVFFMLSKKIMYSLDLYMKTANKPQASTFTVFVDLKRATR